MAWLAQILVTAIAGVAIVAWLVAVLAGLTLIGYRRADISLGRMLFSGWIWFDRRNFRPEGERVWKLFIAGAATFAGAIVAAILVSLVLAQPG